jgi:hypothetical protein
MNPFQAYAACGNEQGYPLQKVNFVFDQLIEREHMTDAVGELQGWIRTLRICERHLWEFQMSALPLNSHSEVK